MRSRFLLSVRIAPAEIGTLPHRQVAGPSSGQFPRAALDKRGNIRLYAVIISFLKADCKFSVPRRVGNTRDSSWSENVRKQKDSCVYFFVSAL
jgi:hypothetical protein